MLYPINLSALFCAPTYNDLYYELRGDLKKKTGPHNLKRNTNYMYEREKTCMRKTYKFKLIIMLQNYLIKERK